MADQLTDDELALWAEHGIPATEAVKWWAGWNGDTGQPADVKRNDDVFTAMSYALSWRIEFGAENLDEARPWVEAFHSVQDAPLVAAQWRNAGWGAEPLTPDLARGFHDSAVSANEARSWVADAGVVDLDDVETYRKAGLTPAAFQALGKREADQHVAEHQSS